MKLLICTQAVDSQDSDLGFFVRWIEEFAKHNEKVTVVTLRKGQYTLPKNVSVIVLGKGSRLRRAWQFWRVCIAHRHDYDAVFVHMNPEYFMVAGLLWRSMGKRAALWYTHKAVNVRLKIATLLANRIFTASKASFRLQNNKVQVMGHGIDTTLFAPDTHISREDFWISAGRLDKIKRHDLAIRAAANAGKELHIVGEGLERENLESLAHQLGVRIVFLGKLSHTQVRDEFRRAALFLHMSETGSLDKLILEAVACGCPVRTNDPALKYLESATPQYVREQHSLERLVPAILEDMKTGL
jgi:glycosyltransferase involved in cell wall biosynthesis